jgi:hypothetical protein
MTSLGPEGRSRPQFERLVVLPGAWTCASGRFGVHLFQGELERSRMTQIMRRGESDRIASATVILADGLRGAMQRSVLTGLMMLAPPPHPAKVFGAIADAVDYLQPYLRQIPGAPTTQSPLSAVLELYESFKSR